MGEINIPRDERDALNAVNAGELDKLIDQCRSEESARFLWPLKLERCGLYVASRLREFEAALADHSKAKAAKKRAETESRVLRSGSDLVYAVQQMKGRVETEKKDAQLFFIDDQIMPPYRFSERLNVRVSYRWRQKTEDDWIVGSITFDHEADLRPDFSIPKPKRKPSAAHQERDHQERLYRIWEYLKMLALSSVRDYFRNGGGGATIPLAFKAKTDNYTQGLNNFSLQFWSAEIAGAQ